MNDKNKKVKSGCEESDRRERVEKVTELLSAVYYKTPEDKDAAILSFTKANLTLGEIEKLIIPLKPDYLAGQVYRKGVM